MRKVVTLAMTMLVMQHATATAHEACVCWKTASLIS